MSWTNDLALEVLRFRIVEPFKKLRQKFGFDEPNVSFSLYDGYQIPQERIGDANSLELEDLLITVAMNSRVGASASQAFWDGCHGHDAWHAESCRLLSKVPKKLDLADATDEDVATIARIFAALCEVDGIKTAIAGKILCRKRPRCAPMLDSVVLPFVCDVSMEFDGAAGNHNRDWCDVARALRFFRHLCITGREPLEALGREFRTLPGSPELSPLRAMESLLWWEMIQDEPSEHRVIAYRRKWPDSK